MKVEVAWLAGLLEGEGCFSIFKRKDRPNSYNCAIHLEMTDEDTVRKAYNVFEVGSVLIRPNVSGRRDTRKRKQTWIWSVQNKAGIRTVCENVIPLMGERRTNKIMELLNVC